MRNVLSFLACFLVLAVPCIAQPMLHIQGVPVTTEYPDAFKKAGIHKARCIFKDRRGILWIGTDYGLFRYDGTNIDYLDHEVNNRQTIPNNVIISVCEDRDGNIWAGTLGGVARITANGLYCTSFTKQSGALGDDFDNKVCADSANNIWVGNSSGVWRLDRSKNKFELVWHSELPGKEGTEYIHSLAEWKKDTLVAGTRTGLVLIDKNNFGFRLVPAASEHFIASHLFVDARHRIWVGTWGQGLILTDESCRKIKMMAWEGKIPLQLSNVVKTLVPDAGNTTLWLATTQGLYRINNYLAPSADYKPIAVPTVNNEAINAMLADKDGFLWLGGTLVSRFFAGNRFFEPVIETKGTVEGMARVSYNGRQSLAVSTWYNTSGLSVADIHTGRYLYVQPVQRDDRNSAISNIAIDKYRRVWVATLGGVMVLDSSFNAANVKPAIAIRNDLLIKSRVNAVHIHHDTVWLANYKKGIQLVDLDFHILKTFLPNDGSGLKDNLITGFFTDSKGTVWACGNSALYRYLPGKQKFALYNLNEDKGAFSVYDISETSDHKLAVATISGLYIFDPSNGKHYHVSSPLVKETDVESVAADRNGNLWYITPEHLVYYQPKTNHFMLFGQEDGLQIHNDLQLIRTFDGKTFYLAETDRIEKFSPSLASKKAERPAIYIHSVQANDSVITRVPGNATLRLNYKQSRLYVEFGMVNYIKPEQNMYVYRLKGLENKWVTTTHNYAAFDNLDPGEYTLYVKAQNSAGTWSTPIGYNIVITPPYWGTWWFRGIAVVALSLLAFFAIRFVTQRNLREKILVLEKEQAIEKERNRIARDMHDDLGSGLTKIAILSEVTKAHIENRKSASGQLETISTVSRELVDSLQNIVWLLNPKNDSLESLALYIRRYVNNFFESSGILPDFDFPADISHIRLSEEQRRNIFLIVKEACNNILKHAGATAVHLKLRHDDDCLLVAISDNGRGFSQELINRFSNGIGNMRNRAEQVGGLLEVIAAPGSGAAIKLIITGVGI